MMHLYEAYGKAKICAESARMRVEERQRALKDARTVEETRLRSEDLAKAEEESKKAELALKDAEVTLNQSLGDFAAFLFAAV